MMVFAGVGAAALFALVGPAFHLQTYGDGSIFSYAVAARDVWDFHWRNIPTRATVYALTLWPGEMSVALTGDAQAGVLVYGLLLFAAPAVGLMATYALDRTSGRIFFVFACASTALLCPLVFGFPTEMWIAHAMFWPTIAAAFSLRPGPVSATALAILMCGLVLSHEGGLVLAFGVAGATSLSGLRDARFVRAALCFVVAVGLWIAVDRCFPPDGYFGEVRVRAASEFFDRSIFESPILSLIASALGSYAALYVAFTRLRWGAPHYLATGVVCCALIVWWASFDHALHADHRYYMRTVLLIGVCNLAAVAVFLVLDDEQAPVARLAPVRAVLVRLRGVLVARFLMGTALVVLLAHAVESAKFVRAFEAYRGAVRALALGDQFDAALGAPYFVSSRRISGDLNRLSWFSTTPYLSALVADFRPKRLVIDPAGNYFWLSCATATRSAEEKSAVPRETREMIRVYSCLHRT